MEHRAHASPPAVRVRLEQGPARLEVEDLSEEAEEGGLESGVLRALAPGRPMTRKTLRERLRVRNERLVETLLALAARGAVARTETGWVVPRSRP